MSIYRPPDSNDPLDAVGHILSEIMNDSAPIGWEKYRGYASFILDSDDLMMLMIEHRERQGRYAILETVERLVAEHDLLAKESKP